MARSLCIIGGGASGVGLVWLLARAQQLGLTTDDWNITLIHDDKKVGGHSATHTVKTSHGEYDVDLGVQMIAPKMYPNIYTMLKMPEMSAVELQPVDLKLAATFPPDASGSTPYWGNFPEYQLKSSLYQQGRQDALTFESLMKDLIDDALYFNDTLEEWLVRFESKFENQTFFKNYFLDPYMSIMNGYGQALLTKVKVLDIAPLFVLDYASFTKASTEFGRFKKGAGFWVQTMFDQAQQHFGKKLQFVNRSQVIGIIPTEGGRPVVEWLTAGGPAEDSGGKKGKKSKQSKKSQPDLALSKDFDWVVSTLDMNSNSRLLNIPKNQQNGWWSFYEPYVGTVTVKDGEDHNSRWPLEPGFCYLHTDDSMFPDGTPTPPDEVLQFTGFWSPPAPTSKDPYDITWTWTTYIERNLLDVSIADDPDFNCYLTMYGFNPNGKVNAEGQPIRVPCKEKIIKKMSWTHGMWLPTFMMPQKEAFGLAQGISPTWKNPLGPPGQRFSNVFFAGNNLTMDSEEGAFGSAMALAKYMFNIDSPKCVAGAGGIEQDMGEAEFWFFYELMFDMASGLKKDGQAAYRRYLRHLFSLAHLFGRGD